MVREHTWYGFKYFKIVWLFICTKTRCILVRVLWILGWRVCELRFCKCPLDPLPQGVSFPRPWWIPESPGSCWKLPTLSVHSSASLSAPLALVLRILRQCLVIRIQDCYAFCTGQSFYPWIILTFVPGNFFALKFTVSVVNIRSSLLFKIQLCRVHLFRSFYFDPTYDIIFEVSFFLNIFFRSFEKFILTTYNFIGVLNHFHLM